MSVVCSLFTQSFLYASAFSFVPFKLFFVFLIFVRSLFDLCLWMAIIALARAIFCHSEAKSGVWCFKTGSWVRYFHIYFVFSSEYRNFAVINRIVVTENSSYRKEKLLK